MIHKKRPLCVYQHNSQLLSTQSYQNPKKKTGVLRELMSQQVRCHSKVPSASLQISSAMQHASAPCYAFIGHDRKWKRSWGEVIRGIGSSASFSSYRWWSDRFLHPAIVVAVGDFDHSRQQC